MLSVPLILLQKHYLYEALHTDVVTLQTDDLYEALHTEPCKLMTHTHTHFKLHGKLHTHTKTHFKNLKIDDDTIFNFLKL